MSDKDFLFLAGALLAFVALRLWAYRVLRGLDRTNPDEPEGREPPQYLP